MEHTPYDAMQTPKQNPLHIQAAIALGKPLAKSLPRMGKVQMKLFFAMLEHIDWRGDAPGNNIVILDNQLVKSRLGWNMKSDAAAAKRVRDGLKGMVRDCMAASPADENAQKTVPLILDVYGNKCYTAVAVNPAFISQMSNLAACKDYFRFDIGDIMGFKSQYSIYLYMELRRRQKYSRSLPAITEVRFSTKGLKDAMGLDFGSYTDRNRPEGHFDRPHFEKDILEKPLEEISQSHMIELYPPEKGIGGTAQKWYRKTKWEGNVKYYYIRFRVREEIFRTEYGSHINAGRFEEISQGFLPEQGKEKYLVWQDGVKKALATGQDTFGNGTGTV